jgi:hypothetical protein
MFQFKAALRWTDQKAAVVSPASVDEMEIAIDYGGGSMVELTSERPVRSVARDLTCDRAATA